MSSWQLQPQGLPYAPWICAAVFGNLTVVCSSGQSDIDTRFKELQEQIEHQQLETEKLVKAKREYLHHSKRLKQMVIREISTATNFHCFSAHLPRLSHHDKNLGNQLVVFPHYTHAQTHALKNEMHYMYSSVHRPSIKVDTHRIRSDLSTTFRT